MPYNLTRHWDTSLQRNFLSSIDQKKRKEKKNIDEYRGIDIFLKTCYSYIKYSPTCDPCITRVCKTSLMSVARQRRPTHVAKGLDMGKRWLLNGMRRGVLSLVSSADNNGDRYFDWDGPEKAVDIVESTGGNVD
jgi:hypothetical protein